MCGVSPKRTCADAGTVAACESASSARRRRSRARCTSSRLRGRRCCSTAASSRARAARRSIATATCRSIRARSTRWCSRTRTSITRARCRCCPRAGSRDDLLHPATRDLCAVMLEDAAMVQEADARFLNKQIERGVLDGDPIEPLYTDKDVVGARDDGRRALPPLVRGRAGVRARFLDAGHVLGSAIVELDVRDGATTKRVVFSGDVGRRSMPILRDPEIPERRRSALLESTYGDRLHPARQEMEDGARRRGPPHRRAWGQGDRPDVRARARAGDHPLAQVPARSRAPSRRCP
jgi:hypothetical protein